MIFGGIFLLIVVIAFVVLNKDAPEINPIDNSYENIDEIQDEPNAEQTIQPENQIDLDMNNLEAECESPIIKCTTEGCVTQC